MRDRRPTSRAIRRRRSWAVFGVVSTVALAACTVAPLRSGDGTGAGLALLGGLIVVGIAAALMHAIVSPYQGAVGGSYTGGDFGGGGGDFGGGGDCGG